LTIAFDIVGLLKSGDDQIACVTAPIVVSRRFTVKRVLISLGSTDIDGTGGVAITHVLPRVQHT
jgi:hypothetical protein